MSFTVRDVREDASQVLEDVEPVTVEVLDNEPPTLMLEEPTGEDVEVIVSGKERIVRRLWVTSSPISPSPRVAPRSNTPLRYSRETANPSILGSVTNSKCGVSIPSRAR